MKLTDFFDKPAIHDPEEKTISKAKDEIKRKIEKEKDEKRETEKKKESHDRKIDAAEPAQDKTGQSEIKHHAAQHKTEKNHKAENEDDAEKEDAGPEKNRNAKKNQDSVSWTQKYRPAKPDELCGIDSSVEKIKNYISRYKPGSKALLINGSPGCGKTSSVYAIANDLMLEVFELNASDDRNKDSIIATAGAAMQQGSIFGTKKIILIEEVDGISESEDRGGITELVSLIPKSRYPVIMTANDPWDRKFSSLRAKSEIVTFNTPTYISVAKVLGKISKNENINVSKEILEAVARRNGGDFRGAINDLQMISSGKHGRDGQEIKEKDLDILGDRKKTESMVNALMRIMKSLDPAVALSAFEDVDENIDEQILWLEENIPAEYTEKDDVRDAFDRLSKSDVFRGRIKRWQHWDFLVYVSALTTAGIALSKKEKYSKYVSYKPTTRILKIWMANQSNARKKSIAGKIAQKTHSSTKEIYSEFDYYRMLFSNDLLVEPLSKIFELDKEDVELLRK